MLPKLLGPVLLFVSLTCACSGDGTNAFPLTATPSHASMAGGMDVALAGNFSGLGTLQSVTIAGVRALDVRATASLVTVHLQGAPAPGPATIILSGTKGSASNQTALRFDPPNGGVPLKWAAFGASLTEGFQSGGLDAHGQVMGYAAQAARAAGVFLGVPLVVDGFLPPMQPSLFVGNCNASWDVSTIGTDVLTTLTDPKTQSLDMRLARQDATLPTRNFAVGGATVADILAPAQGPVSFIERITELPDGDPFHFGARLTRSQIDRLVELDPDVVLSSDLLANDSDGSVTASDDIHLDAFTDVATIQSELTTMAGRLGALHGDYFIANLMDLTGLPNVPALRAQRIAAGQDTAASFDAKVAQVKALIDQYNAALTSALAPYKNLHVVDLETPTSALISLGVVIGGEQLTSHKFGGLLSLDHIHFTDTGYALMANVFIDAMNAMKGWHIPEVDATQVVQNDALSPQSLHADGVYCDGQ